jgi:hypothetical protein
MNVDPTFVLLNRVEACLWFAIALGIAIACTARRRWTVQRCVGVLLLVAFGASDLVETTTGAWWRPWWLFAWKTVCVLGFVGWLWTERASRRRVPSPGTHGEGAQFARR